MAADAIRTMVAADQAALPSSDPTTDGWAASASRTVKAGAAACVLASTAFIGWAVFAPLSGSIVAPGVVKVDTNRKTVQHRDGGIVREILVREGDRVTRDQPLIVLEDMRVDASFDLLRSQLDAQRVREARLLSERDLKSTWALPPALHSRRGEPRIAESFAREDALFNSRRNSLDSQSRLLREQLDEVALEVKAREREHVSVTEALAHMEDEVKINEGLLAQQFVNRTRVLELKRAAAEYRMRMDDNQAELSKARQHGGELRTRIANLRESHVQEASVELRDVGGKMLDLEEQVRTAKDASERKVLTSPVAGRVVDLKVSTVGASIGPREPVLDIVPDDNPLLIEAKVGVDAIAELRRGLPTDVRLTTYNQHTTPMLAGRVVYVSADALVDPQHGGSYYMVHVALTEAALKDAGNLTLQPGMAAEVFIRTRERTPWDYLVEPLTNASRRAFREH